MTVVLAGAWASTQQLNVWYTKFAWDDNMNQLNSTFFTKLAPVDVVNGQFTITIYPDELYTITTLANGNKPNIAQPPAATPFRTPYTDDFNNYAVSSEAQYFADQAGMIQLSI